MLKSFVLVVLLFKSLYAFEVQKPKVYEKQNINGWYMSEKLDGIRAYWDGKNLYTKNKNLIYTPKDFTKNFPPFELDGELWTSRDDFENIQNIVLDKTPSKKWKEITYNIFEVPNTKGDFLTRLNKAKLWFEKHSNTKVQIIKQIKCKNEEDLNRFLKEIISLKGEGVIIKDASKSYHTGRTSNSLKVKKFFDDEAEVVGFNYNEKSEFKSLKVRLKNGVIFNLGGGFSNKDKLKLPKLGDTITFKYYGLTKNGKPKFASFLRIREAE